MKKDNHSKLVLDISGRKYRLSKRPFFVCLFAKLKVYVINQKSTNSILPTQFQATPCFVNKALWELGHSIHICVVNGNLHDTMVALSRCEQD